MNAEKLVAGIGAGSGWDPFSDGTSSLDDSVWVYGVTVAGGSVHSPIIASSVGSFAASFAELSSSWSEVLIPTSSWCVVVNSARVTATYVGVNSW